MIEYFESFTAPTPSEPITKPNNDSLDEEGQFNESGLMTITKGGRTIYCLTIIGQIEGHYVLPPQNKTTKYEHVIPQLVTIEESPEIEGLLVVLNTVGGDIEAGLAIAELISGMEKPTVSLVLGGGHSIGVPLAVAAKHSFITKSSTMTIHPVRMNGLVIGVPQTLAYFENMQERIVRFVSSNSSMKAERFRELMLATGELVMDVGSVLNGETAVKEGVIDSLGGLSDALDNLYKQIEEREISQKEDNTEKSKEEEISKEENTKGSKEEEILKEENAKNLEEDNEGLE